jgi:hypothetical protein
MVSTLEYEKEEGQWHGGLQFAASFFLTAQAKVIWLNTRVRVYLDQLSFYKKWFLVILSKKTRCGCLETSF